MTLPEPPAPTPDCNDCGGDGFIVSQHAERAVARLCECLGPCERCGGAGRLVVQEDGGVRSGRCRCQIRPDRVAMFNRADIPGRYADATLLSFSRGATRHGDDAKFKGFVEASAWLSGFRAREANPGLLLHGRVGRGKTHLLIALLRTLILRQGVPARFIEFSRLLGMLKEGYGAGKSHAPLLNSLVAVPVLGIDELGKGRMTDWELSIIDEVVSRRYNAMGCTLGTTNFPPSPSTGAQPVNAALVDSPNQTMGDRVGDRVYSRLREMCQFVEVGGIDYREIGRP